MLAYTCCYSILNSYESDKEHKQRVDLNKVKSFINKVRLFPILETFTNERYKTGYLWRKKI